MQQVDETVRTLDTAYQQRIDIFYSQYDFTIAPKHTLIDGVRAHRVYVPGHLFAIALLLTILRHRIIAAIA